MNTTKTDSIPAGDGALSEAELRREITALLGSKGIDEHRAKRLRKQWKLHQDGAKPDGSTNDSADDSLAALFVELRERIHAQVALREKQFARVENTLQQLRTSLSNGDVKQSQQLEQSVVDTLNQITGLSSQRRRKIITELEALQPKLRKLAGWRKWGTVQAREKLIREIKDIHNSGASPEKIARRIQRARQEWQEWDNAGEGPNKKLYAVFDRECTTAYAPCQAHFDRQKQQRQQSSETREQLCAQLEQEFEQIEWRDPDWKKLRQLLHARTIEWRNTGAPDHKQRKLLQQRFDAIIARFDQPLERERRRNYKIREKLTEEADLLAQRDDSGAEPVAVQAKLQADLQAELQTLKKKWVVTVPSTRGKEQALWKKFAESCDKVEAKRNRARKDFVRTLKQNLKAGEALCAEIETACRGDAETDAGIHAKPAPSNPDQSNPGQSNLAQSNLNQWKERWEQLGEMPKASIVKITARYRDAVKQAQKTLAKAGIDEEIRRQNLLRQKSLLCVEVEALAVRGDSGEAALTDLASRWDGLDSLPDEAEQTIGDRYRLASAAVLDRDARRQLEDSMPANLETLHGLLLRLEILAGLDSPVEFSRQRMALQIDRLSAVMGRAGQHQASSADRLIADILLVGAVDQSQHTAAFERLDQCLTSIQHKKAEPGKTGPDKTLPKKPSPKKPPKKNPPNKTR